MNKTQTKANYIDIFYKIPEAIENKSYRKIITLGLSIGAGLAIVIATWISIGNIKDDYIKEKKNKVTLITESLKKDHASDYPKFLQYMKIQQNIYNQKIDYISEIIMKAPKENKYGEEYISANYVATLNTNLSKYKVSIGKELVNIQLVYQHILNNQLDSVDYDSLQDFLVFYQLYKANMMYHDKDLEENINDILYSTKEGNRTYNTKYKVFENIKIIDNNMIIKINTLK